MFVVSTELHDSTAFWPSWFKAGLYVCELRLHIWHIPCEAAKPVRTFHWRKGTLWLCRATKPPRNICVCDTLRLFIKAVMDLSTFQSHRSDWESRVKPFQFLREQHSLIRPEIISGHFSCFRWRHFKAPFILDVNIYIYILQAVLMEENTYTWPLQVASSQKKKKQPFGLIAEMYITKYKLLNCKEYCYSSCKELYLRQTTPCLKNKRLLDPKNETREYTQSASPLLQKRRDPGMLELSQVFTGFAWILDSRGH